MAKKKQKKITVGFVALGCPKNIVDSERMLAEIAHAGLIITNDPDNADAVVINTCGFIAPAKAEALDVINHALKMKKKGKIKKIIVAGCLPQREGAKLLDQAKGIDAIVGLDQRDNIAKIVLETLGKKEIAEYLANTGIGIHDDRTRLRITLPHTAYLRISEGCNKKCSFCTIPAIRGPFRSKPMDMIVAEAEELVASGAVELNIIAQDTTYYGSDLDMKDGLVALLQRIEKTAGLRWLRLMYLYPTGFSDRLIDTIADSDKILNYLDIPIQHINDSVLKNMKRPDTKEHITSLIEKLRSKIPNCVLRTTVIVGFPGETNSQFAELIEFIKWARFDNLGCFTFCPELGTAAAELTDQIPDDIKQQRLDELMLTQQQIAFENNERRVGTKLKCLLDSVDENGEGIARFFGQAPDIDSVCIIKNCSHKPSDLFDTKVINTEGYDLICDERV